MQKGTQLRRNTLAALALGSTVVLAGCRQDMHNQPRMFPQRSTTLFADGRSVREQVAGTVAREQGDAEDYIKTGTINGKEGDTFPLPVTPALLLRGQERFNIYCAACHSRVGNGGGEIVDRGYRPAGNFHTDRLRSAPIGHFFNVITYGYGAMPDYAAQVTPEDRWAIAAYIRALQLSQHASQGDVKSGEKVEKLSDVAVKEGLPANFASEWVLPSTAVYGTPDNQDHGVPNEDQVIIRPKGTAATAKPSAVTAEKPAPGTSASPTQHAPGSQQ